MTAHDESLHPAYLDLLGRVTDLQERGGREATQSPQGQKLVARLIAVAPQSYFVLLDARTPGTAAEMKAWSKDLLAREALAEQERRDYPRFFELRRELDDAIAAHGPDGVHGSPCYAGRFIELMRSAPPRYRAIADEVANQFLPNASHVTEDSELVYSADQIARHLDLPVEDVHAVIDAHADPADLHRGPVHTLQ